MLLIIGGIGLALASAVVVAVVRTLRRTQRAKSARGGTNDIGSRQDGTSIERTNEEAERIETQEESLRRTEQEAQRLAADASRRVELEARAAVEQDAQRRADEVRGRVEERARLAAEHEVQRRAEDARRRADEDRRLAAAKEAQRKTEEDARLRAEDAARLTAEAQSRADEAVRVAAEHEAQRKAEEEAHRRSADAARLAAEAQRQAEAREARIAAEQEAQNKALEEARRRTDDEARLAAAARCQAEAEEAIVAAAHEAQRKAAEEAHRRAADAARLAGEAQRQAEAGETRIAAEQEAQNKALEATRRRTDDEARLAEAARRQAEAEGARVAAEHEAQRKLEEEVEAAAEQEGQVRAEVEVSREAEEPGTPEASPRARVPRQFRPLPRVAPVVVQRSISPSAGSHTARDRALPIEVRLVFEKAGFCSVSLLPRRATDMPTELVVTGSGDPPELLALQDEWYQDVVLPNLGRLLRGGIEWAGSLTDGGRVRSSLSGRELYVLARHSAFNGFVSAPRLTLGEEHVVLCVVERVTEARDAIALTGSPEPVLLNSDNGIPAGWAGLRGVVPRTPIAPSPAGDILDALRPLAEVEIALEGGIRIDRQTWLSGFPPSLRLRGDTSTIGTVTIDGHDAALSADGSYAVPGWDSPGEHSVWCASGSRTYEIRSGAEDWEAWDAYAWSLGESSADGTQSRPAICGVLVRPPRIARPDGRAVVAPASNPILIGASPGEIEICTPRNDVRAGLCVGFPWFEPIWAIPANALHCDKRTARVLLIGAPQPVAEGGQHPNSSPGEQRARFRRGRSEGALGWCAAILAAGRKDLQTEPSRIEIADLWKTYKRCARTIRRSWR